MAAEQRIFQVASSPLQRDIHLIEASAGTGKTYAIAMLVLRFVAELGIPIEEILLVTFTRAATAELAERVRARLIQARDLLERREGDADQTLLSWAETLADRERALVNLRQALVDIDRAPIFTIHGFCQRMLQEQTLESGQLFHTELVPENQKLQEMVVADYWRQHIYVLPRLQANVVLAYYSAPAKLSSSVGPLSQSLVAIEPQEEEVELAGQKLAQLYTELATWWQEDGAVLHDTLVKLIEEGVFKKDFTGKFDRWWAALNRYLQDSQSTFPKDLNLLERDELAKQLNGNKVRGARRAELLGQLPLPGKHLSSYVAAVDELLLAVRTNYCHYFLAETQRQMVEANIMAYDDLILLLHRAVTGTEADGLIHLLRRRFSAAVIDEFQDTDNLQWQIFHTVFAGGSHFLYLIGDPKQAIYKFRGADIHSYFQAKGSAAQILTLDKNYRSHPNIVAGVNSLFCRRSQPFLFDKKKLDFSPARSALTGDEVRLYQNDESFASMVYCQLEEAPGQKEGTWSSGEAASAVMQHIVAEIGALLENKTKVAEKQESRTLQPSDIAILVRTHNQAEEYRKLLGQVGIPAVTASKLSVFQSVEASELEQLLDALAHPDDLGLFKRAMTISWLGYSGTELHGLWQDEQLFDHYYARFQEYALSWRQQGLLLMLNHFLEYEGVLTTLGGGEQSERRITNIYHLAELLQEAEEEQMFGPQQLLQWFRHHLEHLLGEYEQRLESDEEAVRIITMHASKGLEYPVVFCPSLWYRSSRLEGEQEHIVCREENGLVLDLGSERFEQRKEAMLVEEMAEELRLCYVSVTRAKLRCYIIWCDHKGRKGGPADSFHSGLGYLLFPEGRVSFAEQQRVLKELSGNDSGAYQLVSATTRLKSFSFQGSDPDDTLKRRIVRRGPLSASYHLTSYSALISGGAPDERSDSVAETGDHEPIVPVLEDPAIPFATLPSGPNFGNVVHDILESIPFAALEEPSGRQEEITTICRRYGVEVDLQVLLTMLRGVVTTPLTSAGKPAISAPSLAQLGEGDCRKEMGFYFHLARGSTADINRLLAEVNTVGMVNEREVRGYLIGFIDLVFVFENTFYIVDYKTNNLGATGESYNQQGLVSAMAEHNYGLQYYLYSLVIHRYLQNVLPEYDYDIHFGGIYYLFVRGMNGGNRGIFFDKPERARLMALAGCFAER